MAYVSNGLGKSLGLVATTSIVVGTVIGSGVFVKPAKVLLAAGTPGLALAAWLAGALLTITAGLTIAEIGARIPKTGGLYAYIEELFGEKIGFLCGWMLSLVYGPSLVAALAAFFAVLLQRFYPYADSLKPVIAISAIAVLTILNVISTKLGGAIATATTIGKLIPVFLIAIVGVLFMPGSPNLSAQVPDVIPGLSSFATAVLATLWAYEGWILVGNMAGEVKDAEKNLPRAIIIGLLIVMIAYMTVNFALFKVLPIETFLEHKDKTINFASTQMFGAAGGLLISIGVLISIAGCLNNNVLTTSRVPFALSGRYHVPVISKVSQAFGTPLNATVMTSLIAVLLIILFDDPHQITDLAVFSIYIFVLMALFGIFQLRKKDNGTYKGYRVPLYPIVPVLAIVSIAFVQYNTFITQMKVSLFGVGVTLLGFLGFAFLSKRRS